jgi:hypothetical protein
MFDSLRSRYHRLRAGMEQRIPGLFGGGTPLESFRVVALVAVRNAEVYLTRCLDHLIEQGVLVCVIDNDSTDQSLEICKRYLGRGVIRIERYPHPGFYDWAGILHFKESLSLEIDAHWFIHYDQDEIREAPPPFKNLKEALWYIHRRGFNAVNFDELVFLPTDPAESFEGRDFVKEMRYYYYFRPAARHRINAWRNLGTPVDLASSGGHKVRFPGRRLFPMHFILRHYIFLSKAHGVDKYCTRVHSPEELERGWHYKREELTPAAIRLPGRKEMKELAPDGRWDLSEPCQRHKFMAT